MQSRCGACAWRMSVGGASSSDGPRWHVDRDHARVRVADDGEDIGAQQLLGRDVPEAQHAWGDFLKGACDVVVWWGEVSSVKGHQTKGGRRVGGACGGEVQEEAVAVDAREALL